MENIIKTLKETGKYIGSTGFGDCLRTYIFELYKKDSKYFLREIYTAGDDDGYDKLKEISYDEALRYMQDEDFYAA